MEGARYSTRVAFARNMKQMAFMKFITGEDLELWYRIKVKTVRPESGI